MAITYLLGAGASFGTVPVQNQLADAIEELTTKFIRFEAFEPSEFVGTNRIGELKKELSDELQWLHRAVVDHGTPDVYAEALFKKRDFVSLRRLKLTYIAFLILVQGATRSHSRYKKLLNKIIDPAHSKRQILGKVKVVSWNYDFQLEKVTSSLKTGPE